MRALGQHRSVDSGLDDVLCYFWFGSVPRTLWMPSYVGGKENIGTRSCYGSTLLGKEIREKRRNKWKENKGKVHRICALGCSNLQENEKKRQSL